MFSFIILLAILYFAYTTYRGIGKNTQASNYTNANGKTRRNVDATEEPVITNNVDLDINVSIPGGTEDQTNLVAQRILTLVANDPGLNIKKITVNQKSETPKKDMNGKKKV